MSRIAWAQTPCNGDISSLEPGEFPSSVARSSLAAGVQRVIAQREIARATVGTVEWQRLTGVEAARLYAASKRPPVDFIFIDGDHSYEGLQGDWEAWSPLVAPQGIIALHDSCSSADRNIEGAGSVIFTRESILPDPRFRLVESVDTLTIMSRCSD